jgi:anti-sigma factor RsiW
MNHVHDRLAALAAGELTPAETDRVQRHLDECAACRREAAAQARLWEQLGETVAAVAGPSVWPAVRERTIDGGTGWFYGPVGWARRGLATAAVAAGLLLGIMAPGGGIAARETDLTTVDLLLAESSLSDGTGTAGLAGIWLEAGAAGTEDQP